MQEASERGRAIPVLSLKGPINSSGRLLREAEGREVGRSIATSSSSSDLVVVVCLINLSDRRTRLNSSSFYERYRRKSNLPPNLWPDGRQTAPNPTTALFFLSVCPQDSSGAIPESASSRLGFHVC